MLAAAFLSLALSRAEIIERFRAQPLVKANGLVQTVADCPSDMRREFLSPVASYAAEICKSLARSQGSAAASRRFRDPGIVIHIGDVRTNLTHVSTVVAEREDGSLQTRLFIPAPGYVDMARLRLEIAKAYFRAADRRECGDAEAFLAMVEADPELRVQDQYERLAAWEDGRPRRDPAGRDPEAPDDADEEYLRLARSVVKPGFARPSDVLRFSSRLMLYPPLFSSPFCGRFRDCTFREAVELAALDPRIRFAALEKAPLVVAFGGGRGQSLSSAASAFSAFLFDLARFDKPKEELLLELHEAETLLAIALDEAETYEKDNYGQYR